MSFWQTVRKLIMEADVVLLILDARMPEISRNNELEKMINDFHKQLILVFNKIDLISEKQMEHLKSQTHKAFFVSGSKNIGISKLKTNLLILGKRLRIMPLKVGIVGYPNVGKSAVINALAKRARTNVAAYAGTTKGLQFVKVSKLKIIDSPGVIPFEDKELKLGLIGAKNPEKLKHSQKLAVEIIKNFIQNNKTALEEFYGIKLETEDEYEIIHAIGKRRGFLLKGGIVDERRVALAIIMDWQKGRLRI